MENQHFGGKSTISMAIQFRVEISKPFPGLALLEMASLSAQPHCHRSSKGDIWGFHKWGYLIAGWFRRENQSYELDDARGYPYDLGNLHIR